MPHGADLPERYGPCKTVCSRFSRWLKPGVINIILIRVLSALDASSLADWSARALDSSNIRALKYSAGTKKSRYRRR